MCPAYIGPAGRSAAKGSRSGCGHWHPATAGLISRPGLARGVAQPTPLVIWSSDVIWRRHRCLIVTRVYTARVMFAGHPDSLPTAPLRCRRRTRVSLSLFSLSFLSLSLSLSRSHRFFPSFVVSLGLQTSQYSSWVAFVDSPTSSRLEVLLPPTVRPVISPLSGLFSAISALPCVCLFLYLLGLHDNVWHHLRSDLFPHPISHRGTLGSSPALPPPSSAPPSPEETLPVLPAG